jgi:signal transduction histidine kinase
MIRSLRSRLILSHILPLVVVVPLMYAALSYLLETRFLVPKLAQDLASDARLLNQVASAQYLLSGDLNSIRFLLLTLDINPQVRLHLLQPDGKLIYSNDPDYLSRLGQRLQVPRLEKLRAGQEVIETSDSFLPGGSYSIQVLTPILGYTNQVEGVLWMTYYEAAITRLFQQMRWLSILVILGCLLVGAILGSLLAWDISKPLRQATQAINSLARSERSEPLAEQGPEEVRDLARTVNVLVERLTNLEQARRQLLANLVHELGRPLGALRSAIQALAKGAAEDPNLLADLTSGMDQEAARLQNVLEELAHLHDQVVGALELKYEATAMSEWLPQVLIPWQEAALAKRLDWTANIPPDLPTVEVDPVRFGQIIGNLAHNAIKYTPPSGAVTIEAGQQEGLLWLRFSDSGVGIPPEEQEKIFQPFYRGSQGRRIKQGMGLGLSIANDLTMAHGGRITVESQPGQGSQFTVWLPLE